MYLVRVTQRPEEGNRRIRTGYLTQRKFMTTTYWDISHKDDAHNFDLKKDAEKAGASWREGLKTRSWEVYTV